MLHVPGAGWWTAGWLALLLSAHAQVSVRVEDSGPMRERRGADGEVTAWERVLALRNGGPVDYRLRCVTDPAANSTVAVLGGGWYHNGTLAVRIDDRPLFRRSAARTAWEATGGRASVAWTWDDPAAGRVRLRTVVLSGDEKLFWELRAERPAALRVDLLAFPGHFGQGMDPACDRWMSTALRSVRHGRGVERLDPRREPWVYLFDAAANRRGTCAVLVLPEDCREATVDQQSNYGVTVALNAEPRANRLRFLLWSFPAGYRQPAAAWNFLREQAQANLEQLARMDFEPAEPGETP